MSANGKIGIAIQGAGTVSSGHLRAYLRNPLVEVVAIERELQLTKNRIGIRRHFAFE